MSDATFTVAVTRPAPSNSGNTGYAVPAVQLPDACPPCDVPRTCCGLLADSPLAHVNTATCDGAVGCDLPIISLADLAAHPRGSCVVAGIDPGYLSASIAAVTAKIADRYGVKTIGPCYATRCFRIGGEAAHIDGLLRLDKAEIADMCGCHQCDAVWRELRLCDLVVGPHNEAPWRTVARCDSGLWCGGHLRLTGIWGDIWPIHGAVKLATILLVAKTIENAKAKGQVVTNRESGTVTVDVPEFDFAELALLPNSLFHQRGWGV